MLQLNKINFDRKKRDRMNKQASPFWLAIKQFMKRVWRVIRYVWYRLQLTRWLILAVLILIFAMSSWLTFKAKTANVGEIKANLQTPTALYDIKDERAGRYIRKKGLMSILIRYRRRFKMLFCRLKIGPFIPIMDSVLKG